MNTTRACILYIDDDHALVRLVQKSLQAHGYVVEHAASADEGFERLSRGGIDVVALDHHLPGQTGLDILKRIRALENPPPAIYVTGSEDSRVAVAALKAGAVDYVWKDVQGHFRELLAESISTALDQEQMRIAKEKAEHEVRAARDRAEMMLKEVNHRVANSLALVAALVRMQAMALTDTKSRDALDETEVRIHAVAGVHRRLYTSADVAAVRIDTYLEGLIEEIRTSITGAGRGHSISFKADPVDLSPDIAVSIGVLVSELVTNALKYAYVAETGGEVRISFTCPEERCELVVEDDGQGWSENAPAIGTGLGSKIIDAMVRKLDGTRRRDASFRGSRIVIEFPRGRLSA